MDQDTCDECKCTNPSGAAHFDWHCGGCLERLQDCQCDTPPGVLCQDCTEVAELDEGGRV